MKRFLSLTLLILTLTIFLASSFPAKAQDSIISEQEESLGLKDAVEALPKDTLDELEGIGIDPSHPTEGMKKFTLADLWKKISSYLFDSLSPPFKSLSVILAIIFLSSLLPFEDKRIIKSVSVAGVSIAVITPLLSLLKSFTASLSAATDFITAMLPVFSSLMLSSGMAISSSFISGCIIVVSQVISRIASSFFLPFTCSGLSLSAVGSFVPELKTESIAASARKFAIWAICGILVVYLSFLGIQSGITSSLDGLTQKTAKLTVSSAIPIVGSIISDASDTVFGAAQLIKSGIGGFSFVAIILIFIKPILLGAAWIAALKTATFIASSFGNKEIETLTDAAQKTISVAIALLAASAVALIISIAVMVRLRM